MYHRVEEKIIDLLKEKNISYLPYQFSLKEKKIISEEAKEIIRKYQPSGNLTKDKAIDLTVFKQKGYHKFIDPLLNQDQVNEILNYLERQKAYPQHIAYYDKHHPIEKPFDYKGKILSFSPDTIFNAPHLIELISSDNVLKPVVDYFGVLPSLFDINIVVSNGSEQKIKYHETQDYHRDHDDFHHILLMVYLTDVGQKDGPHIYATGTQLTNSKSSSLKPKIFENNSVLDVLHSDEKFNNELITGTKGSGFLTDATGLHAGSVPEKNRRRIMFWARYGISKNYMWEHHNHRYWGYDNKIFEKRIKNFTDEKKFIFRFFSEDYDKKYWRNYKTIGDGCMKKTVYKKWNIGIMNSYYYAINQNYGPIKLDDIFYEEYNQNLTEFHKFCKSKGILFDRDDLKIIQKINYFEKKGKVFTYLNTIKNNMKKIFFSA